MNERTGAPGIGSRLTPAVRAARRAVARAAETIAREVRDYDVPGRVRALELDRHAEVAARKAAELARIGGAKAGAGAVEASKATAQAARRLRERSVAGAETMRTRRIERARRQHQAVVDAQAAEAAPSAPAPLVPDSYKAILAGAQPPRQAEAAPASSPAAVAPQPAAAPAPASALSQPAARRVEQYHEPGLVERLGKGKYLMVGVLGLAAGAGLYALAAGGVPLTPADVDRARIEGIVRDYILEHPEILPEAMERLQSREAAKAVSDNREAIETPFAGGWAGNPDGDVVLVEFFDYACGYCRRSVNDIERLLAEDKKLKVVFREFPVLGPESEEAAKVSLSAAKQGRFMEFHRAMFAGGRPSRVSIGQAQAKAGLDSAKIAGDRSASDVAGEIDQNVALARSLGLSGTPAFIVGDRVLGGAVGYEKIREAIADVRRRRAG